MGRRRGSQLLNASRWTGRREQLKQQNVRISKELGLDLSNMLPWKVCLFDNGWVLWTLLVFWRHCWRIVEKEGLSTASWQGPVLALSGLGHCAVCSCG